MMGTGYGYWASAAATVYFNCIVLHICINAVNTSACQVGTLEVHDLAEVQHSVLCNATDSNYHLNCPIQRPVMS